MHASIAGQIMCAAPECVQPGTALVPVGLTSSGNLIELEFCERHLTLTMESGTLADT
jgi:hypothetical protein